MNNIGKYTKQVTLFYHNALLLCLTLLHNHFAYKPAQFHREIFDFLAKKNRFNVIVAPRDHAKSTVVTLGYLIHQILYLQARFIIIVSDTELQAKYLLNAVKSELESNDFIKEIFGELRGDVWGEEAIETNTGVRIIVRGANQKIRGLKWKWRRPDLIVIDDLENDELVENKERREKLWLWLWKSVVPALAKPHGRLIYVGTILHDDSVLNRLVKGEIDADESKKNNVRFHFKFYKAIQEDGTALWSEKYSLEDLESIKAQYRQQGLLDLFFCEYLNDPISDENRIFKKAWFKYYPPDEYLINSLAKFITVDLAISKKMTADYTVITVSGIDANKYIYVLEYSRGRFTPNETIDEIFRLAKKWAVSKIGVESVAYQKSLIYWIEDKMRNDNEFYLVEELKADVDNERRIRGLQPRYAAGTVLHNKACCGELEEELLRFPKAAHDDIATTIAYIPQIAFPGESVNKIKHEQTERSYAYSHAGGSEPASDYSSFE